MENHKTFPTSRQIAMDEVENYFPLNGNLSQRAESSRFPESVISTTPNSNRINPLAADLSPSSAAELPAEVSDSSIETEDPEGTQEVNPSTPNCVKEEDDLLKSSLEGPAENNYINLTNCLTFTIKESEFVPKAVSSPAETIPMAKEKRDPAPGAASAAPAAVAAKAVAAIKQKLQQPQLLLVL